MQMERLFSAAELNAQVTEGMVKISPHPGGALRILNYTKRAQYTPELWNYVTDQCRGLIVDGKDEIVARPFAKFWNLNDARHPETLTENLPAYAPVLTRKVDGSLGVGYRLGGLWYVATRGSFVSEQAQWASAWLAANSPSIWPEGWTPLFEIVYPENQIVVRYGFSGLVLLALVNIETGEEAAYADLVEHGTRNGIAVVEMFDRPLEQAAIEDVANEEGYVATWARAGMPPLRCKIKYGNYVRLHRLLTGTNAATVWEMLRDGLDVAALTTDVPDEFRVWIDAMIARFIEGFRKIEAAAREAMDAYSGGRDFKDVEQKKEFALWVQNGHKELAPILFAMSNGKSYDGIIWKMIRPRGDEPPYKSDDG